MHMGVKKETLAQGFSCDLRKVFKNTFFTEPFFADFCYWEGISCLAFNSYVQYADVPYIVDQHSMQHICIGPRHAHRSQLQATRSRPWHPPHPHPHPPNPLGQRRQEKHESNSVMEGAHNAP